jgi:hypothetical protein
MIRSLDGIIADSASVSVMIERIGSRSQRWQTIKRSRFLHGRQDILLLPRVPKNRNSNNNGGQTTATTVPKDGCGGGDDSADSADEDDDEDEHQMPSNGNNTTTMSSLSGSASAESSSTTSSNCSSSDQQLPNSSKHRRSSSKHRDKKHKRMKRSASSSEEGNGDGEEAGADNADAQMSSKKQAKRSKRHPQEGRTGSSNSEESSGDSYSSIRNRDDDDKLESNTKDDAPSKTHDAGKSTGLEQGVVYSGEVDVEGDSNKKLQSDELSKSNTNHLDEQQQKSIFSSSSSSPPLLTSASLMQLPKLAKSGGIVHNIQPMLHDLSGGCAGTKTHHVVGHASVLPLHGIHPTTRMGPTPLPALSQHDLLHPHPSGSLHYIGSTSHDHRQHRSVVPAVILNSDRHHAGLKSDGSGQYHDELGASYSINEDDMILMDDTLMCPFVFRSRNAVQCGALADCVMPGMLRAQFSNKTNKMISVEMIYDAMGFMQQLDRANGGEMTAQIIPASLEMALMHTPNEARVVTEAKAPYCVVHVTEQWSELMHYSQLEVEGKELLSLLEGEHTVADTGDRKGKPTHNLEDVANGICACSTNVHYDKEGRAFVDFMCSYPLTK